MKLVTLDMHHVFCRRANSCGQHMIWVFWCYKNLFRKHTEYFFVILWVSKFKKIGNTFKFLCDLFNFLQLKSKEQLFLMKFWNFHPLRFWGMYISLPSGHCQGTKYFFASIWKIEIKIIARNNILKSPVFAAKKSK